MKLSSPVATLVAVAMLTLAGCTGSGSGASDDAENAERDLRGSGAIVTPADAVADPTELLARPRTGIAADITLDTCETRSGAVEAKGTATNASGKRKDLVVSVAWVAPEGSDVLARATTAVTNTGNVPVTDVMVDDPKVGPVTCDVTSLAPGESTDCSADEVYVITQADVDAGSVDNTATSTGTPPTGPPVDSPPDSTSTPTDGTASLSLDKRAGVPVDVNDNGVTDAGDTILYTFTVTNTGSLTLLGIKVHDRLAGQVSCDATALAPGESTDCAAVEPYVITEADTSAGMVHNVAAALGEPTVCPSQPKAAKGCPAVKSNEDETVTATASVPALDLVKRAGPVTDVNGSGRTDAGDTIVYEFSVSNVGSIPLVAIDVIDDKLSAAGVDVSCPRDELAPGTAMVCESDPYTITGADDAHGSVDNVATVEGETLGGGTVGSDPSTAVVSIERDPGELPNTGSGYSWWMPLVGLGLLAVGVGLTMAKPRRRARHT